LINVSDLIKFAKNINFIGLRS